MQLGIWHVFSSLLPAKRVFAFGARWFPHLMQMIYITMRLVPQLRQRTQAIQDVLETRGFQRTTGTFQMRQKIREQLPLMNALLEESLEGSWHRAEAMLLRGYGQSKRKRSFFIEDQWSWRDAVVIGSTLSCLLSLWFVYFIIGFLIPLILIGKKAGQSNEY